MTRRFFDFILRPFLSFCCEAVGGVMEEFWRRVGASPCVLKGEDKALPSED